MGKPASRVSACFEHFGSRWRPLAKRKSQPPIFTPEKILAPADAARLDDARTRGCQMAIFKNARALRALILACGMVWLGPAGISVAGPAGILYGPSPRIDSDEPFGRYTRPIYSGGLL